MVNNISEIEDQMNFIDCTNVNIVLCRLCHVRYTIFSSNTTPGLFSSNTITNFARLTKGIQVEIAYSLVIFHYHCK